MTYRKNRIRKIHTHKHGIAHTGKVAAITETDQEQCVDVVHNQLLVVFSRCFDLQDKDLLEPISELNQVIIFK